MITKKQIDRITITAAEAGLRVLHRCRTSKTLYDSYGDQVGRMNVPVAAHIIIIHPSSESLYRWILAEKEQRNDLGF